MNWVNPPLVDFGRRNTVIHGRGHRHYAAWAGPVSVKSVRKGSATWTTSSGRFDLEPQSFLLVNDGEPYTIEVDEDIAVETFCVFFRRGFVEDAFNTASSSDAKLLDEPERVSPAGLFSRMHQSAEISAQLNRMRSVQGCAEWEDSCFRLASLLSGLRDDVQREAARIPAVRPSTREELHRRVLRGLQFLEEQYDAAPDLTDAARHACLSPFHFHRLFTAAFGETPQRYLARRRMERAAGLLRNSEARLAEVCARIGLDSLPSFVRDFRRRYGVSPGEYRRALAD